MDIEKMKAELALLKSKRKPELTEAQRQAKEEESRLLAELHAERAAVRKEENSDIIAAHVPNATRMFFDFDPECIRPATIERGGKTYAFHTRFVVKGATADMLEAHGDAITAQIDQASGNVSPVIDLGKQTAIAAKAAIDCIVWPTAKDSGVSDDAHRASIAESLRELGSARVELGNAAIELATKGAKQRYSKS